LSETIQLLIGTRNKKKAAELRHLLADLPVDVLDLLDVAPELKVEETGATFEANAIAKATEVARATGLLTLADDSGLEVDALDCRPGVHSARFAGDDQNDARNIAKVLKLMKDIPKERRTARFRCVVAVARPEKVLFTTEGVCSGLIASEPKGARGFGYDPVFYSLELEKTFAEVPSEVKHRYSHRAKALAEAKRKLAGMLAG